MVSSNWARGMDLQIFSCIDSLDITASSRTTMIALTYSWSLRCTISVAMSLNLSSGNNVVGHSSSGLVGASSSF